MTVDQKNHFSFSLPQGWRKNWRLGDIYEAPGLGTLHFLSVGEAGTPAKSDVDTKVLQAVRLGSGQDGSLVQYSARQVTYGLSFVFHERQVLVRHYCPPKQREASPALLTTLAGTIQFDAAPLVAENEQERERPSRRRSGGWILWLGAGLLLLATTAPPYLGARGGYAMAEATGGNVRSGAAQGALQAVSASLTCYTLVLVALLWYWAASAPSGSGVMTPAAASFFVTIFLVLGAIALIAVAGTLAAAGAYLGASRGSSSAGLLAALFTVLGFFVTPAWLASMPDHHNNRRHHSSLPAAIRVQV